MTQYIAAVSITLVPLSGQPVGTAVDHIEATLTDLDGVQPSQTVDVSPGASSATFSSPVGDGRFSTTLQAKGADSANIGTAYVTPEATTPGYVVPVPPAPAPDPVPAPVDVTVQVPGGGSMSFSPIA